MKPYSAWTGTARTMALGIDSAVAAARSTDLEGFTDSLTQLAVLLGSVTRDLIERGHADGLDSEGAELLLQSCIRSAAGWYPELDTDALIRALTGALGLGDQDESDGPTGSGDPAGAHAPARPAGRAVVAHGLLLIADQLTTAKQELAPLLDAALRELERGQTIELP